MLWGAFVKPSKYGDPHVSLGTRVFCLPFSSQSNFSEQPFGECISHNGCVFLKGSGTQMNSFAFHELRVNSFLTALPHARLIPHICLPSCDISYRRLLTECWRRRRQTHVPPPSSRTTFLFFSRGFSDRCWLPFICVAVLGFKHHLVHVAERAVNIAMF